MAMSAQSLGLILFSTTLSALAQIAFKFGLGTAAGSSPRMSLLGAFLAPSVIVGLALYAISMLFWLNALSRVELSQAYPFVGLGFVLTTLAGWVLFGDSLSTQRLVGIALVVGGIVLVARY